MTACQRQIQMSHAKDGVLLRTQFDNVYILRVNNAILHFLPFFTQLNSYLPHILLKITSFLLPIWSTFVYEASLLSLSLNARAPFKITLFFFLHQSFDMISNTDVSIVARRKRERKNHRYLLFNIQFTIHHLIIWTEWWHHSSSLPFSPSPVTPASSS